MNTSRRLSIGIAERLEPRRAPGLALALALLLSPATAQAQELEQQQQEHAEWFHLFTQEMGVHRVEFEELVAAGLPEEALRVERLSLHHQGEPIPIAVDARREGWFGPGDEFEFLSVGLRGERSHHHEFAQENVFQLRLDGEASFFSSETSGTDETRPDSSGATVSSGAPGSSGFPGLAATLHLEEDELFIRVPVRPNATEEEKPELWFWKRLAHTQRQRTVFSFDLPDVKTAAEATLAIQLHALSNQRPRTELPDHHLEIILNGRKLPAAEWDQKGAHRVELTLPAGLLNRDDNRLQMWIPRRKPDPSARAIIDVVMLNWIEVNYAVAPQRLQPNTAYRVQPGGPPELRLPEDSRVFSGSGLRLRPEAATAALRASDSPIFLASAAQRHSLERIEVAPLAHLRSPGNGADYLLISHPRLQASTRPLAAFHRSRGLRVAEVDIESVYAEFSGGIPTPQALKDFISHAYHEWESPRPRYVLLVGDASWDTKHTTVAEANYANRSDRLGVGDGFREKDLTHYGAGENLNDRNLIPTWNFDSTEGHSASDNWFVSVDGDDFYPDLAIGRFPVVAASEVEAIVEKTLRYATSPPVGPWRRNILWITNDQAAFQRRTDHLASDSEAAGFEAVKVYPAADDEDNSAHQQSLQTAFNEGQMLVHFYGHGGRLIWRTGPPDLEKNHDLFTLEHVSDLEENERLPLVLSMTCFSAPFDHPSADSIGERFLRVADRGAIGVYAASWRNAPSVTVSRDLVERLLVPGTPMGEAIRLAKHSTKNRNLVETYNLLGDPAIPLAVPARAITLALETTRPPTLNAVVELDGFEGQALVEWLALDGSVLQSEQFAAQRTLTHRYTGTTPPHRALVYVWNEELGVDALGSLEVSAPPEETSATAARP